MTLAPTQQISIATLSQIDGFEGETAFGRAAVASQGDQFTIGLRDSFNGSDRYTRYDLDARGKLIGVESKSVFVRAIGPRLFEPVLDSVESPTHGLGDLVISICDRQRSG